jgi:hypothetical protein
MGYTREKSRGSYCVPGCSVIAGSGRYCYWVTPSVRPAYSTCRWNLFQIDSIGGSMTTGASTSRVDPDLWEAVTWLTQISVWALAESSQTHIFISHCQVCSATQSPYWFHIEWIIWAAIYVRAMTSWKTFFLVHFSLPPLSCTKLE